MDIEGFIDRVRTSLGCKNQADLARKLKISAAKLSYWKNNSPDFEYIFDFLAHESDIDIAFIITGKMSDTPPSPSVDIDQLAEELSERLSNTISQRCDSAVDRRLEVRGELPRSSATPGGVPSRTVDH